MDVCTSRVFKRSGGRVVGTESELCKVVSMGVARALPGCHFASFVQ